MENVTIKDLLSKMPKIVHLKVFTTKETGESNKSIRCPACEDVVVMVRELAKNANKKIDWEEISIITDEEKCKKYGVTRAPTILFIDYNIRYTGAPIGLETAPFIQTLLWVSSGETAFGTSFDDQLARIKKKANLRIIVTPTCPYCAQTVLMENALAIQSKNKISVEIVESYENPDIARQYEVTGVPVTIVNETNKIVGVPNLAMLLMNMTEDKSKLNELYG